MLSSQNNDKNEIFWGNFEAWIAYWRLNIHRFCTEYFGLNLHPFQKILLYLMNLPTMSVFIFFASRGLGKSFLTMVFCLAKGVLYPGIKIAVASSTIKQATLLIKKVDGLRKDFPNIDREIEDVKVNKDGAQIILRGGSIIETVVCSDSARGNRANILILDESRLMDKGIINTVLRNFLTSKRTPPFLNNPKYADYAKYENNSTLYLTSIGTKAEWSYTDFLNAIDFIEKGSNEYYVMALPYQFGTACSPPVIDRKLIEAQLRENKTDVKLFQMEMEVIPFGESEYSMFKFEDLNRARKLRLPLIPPTDDEYIECRGNLRRLKTYQKKRSDEIRVISMDIAVGSGKQNDNSVFTVFRLTENGEYYDKEISYIEVMNGVNLDPQIVRLKQLFYDLECDYAVVDAGGGLGINAMNTCGQKTPDPARSKRYPGWKTMNKTEKFDDRVSDPAAEAVVYPIQVSGGSASQMQYDMLVGAQLEFQRNRISLLVDPEEATEELNKRFGYMTLRTSNYAVDKEKSNVMITSFQNTNKLIEEAIKTQMIKLPSGRFTYDEKNGRKDRVISMIYGLSFINLLEEDLRQVITNYSVHDYFGTSKSVGSGGSTTINPFSNNLSKINKSRFGSR